MRRLLSAALLAVSLVALTGCWQTVTIGRRSLVLGLGVDPGSRPGTVRYTFQMPTAQYLQSLSQGQGGGSQSKPFFTLTQESESLNGAIVTAENASARDLYLGQLQFIVVSAKLAPRQLADFLDEVARTGEIQQSEYLLATTGETKPLLEQKVVQEALPALFVEGRFHCPSCTEEDLHLRVYQAVNLGFDPSTDIAAPVLDQKEPGILDVSRVLVFRQFAPRAVLSEQATRGWAWLTGRMKKEVIGAKTPYGVGYLRGVRGRTNVRAVVDGNGKPYLDVEVEARGMIERKPQGVEVISPAVASEMATAGAEAIRKDVLAALAEARRAGTEPFNLGARFKTEGSPVYRTAATWREDFAALPVMVRAHLALPEQGSLL